MKTVAASALLAQAQTATEGWSGLGLVLIILIGVLLVVGRALVATIAALAAVAAVAAGGIFASLRAFVVVAGAVGLLLVIAFSGGNDAPAAAGSPVVQLTEVPGTPAGDAPLKMEPDGLPGEGG